MTRQICSSRPCSYHWGTGTPGSVCRRYMGRRSPCEINLKDQQEDKEGSTQPGVDKPEVWLLEVGGNRDREGGIFSGWEPAGQAGQEVGVV